MLYKIKNEYYVKVGMKYAKVTLKVKNDSVSIEPTSDYLEVNRDTVIEQIVFNDDFKKSYIKKSSKPKFNEDVEIRKKTSYRR